MKKLILAVVLFVFVVSDANAVTLSTGDNLTLGSASVTFPESRLSLFATATNFPKNDAVDKYETTYRPALEFETDYLKKGNFSLIPGFYYATIGIDKDKKEYTVNPAVAASIRYTILDFISLQAGYGTNGGDKAGMIYGGKFNIYTFQNDFRLDAGMLFSNIGEPVSSVFAGISIPIY